MSSSCRILALDGGGIRGVIPAYLLAVLEAQLGRPIYQCFDVIAGTSTGGLISLALTTPGASGAPMTAVDALNLYLQDGKEIFVKQGILNFGIFEALYSGAAVESWMQQQFPTGMTLARARTAMKALGTRLGVSVPRQVLTTTYTVRSADAAVRVGPYLFNWEDAAARPADDYEVWEAARATSAAPVYFPMAHVGSIARPGTTGADRWTIDGGMMANNPALFALAWAARNRLFPGLDGVSILSLGTGMYDPPLNPNDSDFGAGNWGVHRWGLDELIATQFPIVNVLTTANIQAPDAQLRLLLPDGGYHRLEPRLPESLEPMDTTKTGPLLQAAADYAWPYPPPPGVTLPSAPTQPGPGYPLLQNVIQSFQGAGPG